MKIHPISLIAASLITVASAAENDNNLLLWYKAPAEKWIEALPVGNGRLGAMIFGGIASERLALNDITVWSGGPQPDANRKDGWKYLPEVQKALREGRYQDTDKLAKDHLTCQSDYDQNKYQALGDLKVDFTLPTDPIMEYRRWLDIDTAVAGVKFTTGGVTFQRETFSSAPDKAIVQRFSANKSGSLTFSVSLSRNEKAQTRFVAPDTLVMTGNTGSSLDYEVHARIITKGGTIKSDGDKLTVTAADDALLLLTENTSYVPDYAKGFKGADPSLAGRMMDAVAAKDYKQLKFAHTADYQKYFHRVKLDLGSTEAGSEPTDTRLEAFHHGVNDPGLAALFYQFGRYLLISCSRPENPVPANLQGLWAEGMRTPWNGDYTININFQMNYWPAEMTGLSEMHQPMLRHIQSLVQPGRNSAKATFGPDTPGWVTGPKSNIWGWTSSGGGLPWGIWFGSNGWLCQHLWEHYAYTGDVAYLRSVYPTMKSACDFWLQKGLVEGQDGKLIPSLSSSPENQFTTDDKITGSLDEGTAMDKAIVWELLDNTSRAASILGESPDYIGKLKTTRDRIRPQQIGKAGQLMEWSGDWDMNAKSMDHRHPSHLYALHPGSQIGIKQTPELAAAAKKSLELRGDDGTGWSKAWKINLWTRLRDGDRAYQLLTEQLKPTRETRTKTTAGGTYPNLFDAHPPFQIDGNFGAVSGITEMFLQSQEHDVSQSAPTENRYLIDLLPALPKVWPSGSIKGLRARGGFEIDLTWKDAALTEVVIRSTWGSNPRICYKDKIVNCDLKVGQSLVLNGSLQSVPTKQSIKDK